MRTTIDLAPDVAHPVDMLRRQRGVRRDVVINDLIRIGLARVQAPSPRFTSKRTRSA